MTKKLFKRKKGPNVKAVLVNYDWDKMFEESMASGKGFLITDRNGVDDKNNRTENGIYSPRFGTNWG